MLDQISGTVFNVPMGGGTNGLTVENFMRVMGSNQTGEGAGFKPIQPTNASLQTGTDATTSYFDSLERLNRFGMDMAAKGVDVFRPNSRNPQSITANREFSRLLRDVQMQGNGLRAGQEVAKQFTQQRLKPNVVSDGPLLQPDEQGFTGASTSADFERLVNLSPFPKQLDAAVKSINLMANSYDSQVEADDANANINSRRTQLANLRNDMIESGLPPQVVDALIENAQNRIGKATFDPTKKRELDLKSSRIAAQNDKDRAAAEKNRAQAGKARKIGKKTDEQVLLRKETIERIQLGDLDTVSALAGGKVGKRTITDVQFLKGGDLFSGTDDEGNPIPTGNRETNTLQITFDNGDTQEVPMGGEGGGSFFEINNILNTAPGQEKFSIEDLNDDTSSLSNSDKTEISTGGFDPNQTIEIKNADGSRTIQMTIQEFFDKGKNETILQKGLDSGRITIKK